MRLMGKLCPSKSFKLKPERQRVKALDPELLRKLAKDLRSEASTKTADQKSDDESKEVYRLTADASEGEVGKGWAVGPMTEQEVSEFLKCSDWVPREDLAWIKAFEKSRMVP